jgi:hypothetical protein
MITGRAVEGIEALVPALFGAPIPEQQRDKIVDLLRYWGYGDVGDQLVSGWAETDGAIAGPPGRGAPYRAFL